MRKQECRANFLDNSFRDLQRQLDSDRLEIYCTNQDYEEPTHEVGELRRAQEMRIDEFSRNELRKPRHNTGAHFTSTGVAGKNELYE